MNLHTRQGRLSPVAPFDFDKALEFLGYFKPITGEQAVTQQQLVKALHENGQTIVFRLVSAGKVDQPALDYTLYAADPISPETEQTVLDRISFFLSLNDDLKPFYELATQDEAFAPLIEELYGYHQVKFLTPFENACWAILSQRNLMNVSLKMKQNLAKHFKNCLEVDDQEFLAFPEAEQVSHLSTAEIDDLIHNERKAECISSAAAAFERADENWLRTAPYAEAEKWLRSIRGIGEWSASFVLLRGLGRMEQVPVGEMKLQGAAGQVYRHGHRVTQEDLVKLGEPYGQWRGYWAHYLRVGAS